jgi:hypothetical protein
MGQYPKGENRPDETGNESKLWLKFSALGREFVIYRRKGRIGSLGNWNVMAVFGLTARAIG